MGRIGFLTLLSLVVLLLDFYCFKAINSVFKKWSLATRRNFAIVWWVVNLGLIIGVWKISGK